MSGEPEIAAHRYHPFRRLGHSFVSADSYGLVLLLIVLTYGLSSTLSAAWAPSVVLFVQIVTVWFALRTSGARRSVLLVASVVLLIAGVVGAVGVFASSSEDVPPLIFFVSCLLYVIAPVSIARHLVLRTIVDLETMLGAISAYLLIGMCFAFLYRGVGVLQDTPFFGSAGDGTIGQTLFFSFTTLTTTGFGNLVPAYEPGQSLAVAEMVLGQLFLITAVGKIVSAWKPRTWSTGETP
ncbi:MAG: ion channel [Actinomycetota bacterium]